MFIDRVRDLITKFGTPATLINESYNSYDVASDELVKVRTTTDITFYGNYKYERQAKGRDSSGTQILHGYVAAKGVDTIQINDSISYDNKVYSVIFVREYRLSGEIIAYEVRGTD